MGFNNLLQFQRDLDDFAEVQVPREFVRRQIDATIFLLKKLRWYTPTLTGHAQRNWLIAVDDEVREENGVRTGNFGKDESTTAEFKSLDTIRGELSGKYVLGAKASSKSTFHVYNASTRYWKGKQFNYVEAIINGTMQNAPNDFLTIAISETIGFIEMQGRK